MTLKKQSGIFVNVGIYQQRFTLSFTDNIYFGVFYNFSYFYDVFININYKNIKLFLKIKRGP